MSRTAFTAGEITNLRLQPQALIGLGLAVHRPSIVWQGTIDTNPTYPADGTGVGQLTVTGTTGSSAAVQEGMTVLLHGTGTYKTYARKAPGATTLYIDGLGKGTIDLSGTRTFVVYNEYLPWPRRFRYDSGSGDWFCNFDETYVAQNTNFGPLVIMGPSAVIYKNGSQTFSFDGRRSIAMTPGSSISSYLWTFPDATTSTSSHPTWATSTAYPNGAYVDLLVTDSNGDTNTGHRLIFKFDSTNLPKLDFRAATLSGQWGEGWECEIESADASWTDGAYKGAVNHVVVFGDTYYNTTAANIGGNFPNRENIWFDGWVMESHPEQTNDFITYTYQLRTIDALLDMQDAFPVALDDAGSAANWLEMTPCQLDLIGFHYARWRSTISLMADLTLAALTITETDKFGMDLDPDKTMWGQLQQIYSWIAGGTVSVDSQSGIYCEQDAITGGVVSGLPQMLSLYYTKTFVREGYAFPSRPDYLKPVSQVTLYSVNYSTPVGSRAPDDPIAHGGHKEETPAGLMGDQALLNTWAGNMRARLNNPDLMKRYPLTGIERIDPTPQSTVSVDGGSTYSRIVRACEIEFDFENGMAYTTIDCEALETASQSDGIDIVFTTL